jgi:uncharacterized phage-associated protein
VLLYNGALSTGYTFGLLSLVKTPGQGMAKRSPFRFDPEKAVEVVLYIANRAPIRDVYHVLKLLYFADKAHLERYGRFICGDNYVAMKSGAVPSGTYDIIKDIRGDGIHSFTEHARHAFTLQDEVIISPLRHADTTILSESDIECLDESIEKYGSLSGAELKRHSHDEAYKAADENDFIDVEKIAGMFPDGEKLIKHLQDPYPG